MLRPGKPDVILSMTSLLSTKMVTGGVPVGIDQRLESMWRMMRIAMEPWCSARSDVSREGVQRTYP